PIEAEADDLLPGEEIAPPSERVGVLVDDGHRVAELLEADRQFAADPAAPHDDDVHRTSPSPRGPDALLATGPDRRDRTDRSGSGEHRVHGCRASREWMACWARFGQWWDRGGS